MVVGRALENAGGVLPADRVIDCEYLQRDQPVVYVMYLLDCVSTGAVSHRPVQFSFITYTHNNGEDSEITSKKTSKLTSQEFLL